MLPVFLTLPINQDTKKRVTQKVTYFDFKLILSLLCYLDISIDPTLSTYTTGGRRYCIAMPASLQSNPPQHAGPEVTLVEREETVVFVAAMGGFPDNREEADKLRSPGQERLT